MTTTELITKLIEQKLVMKVGEDDYIITNKLERSTGLVKANTIDYKSLYKQFIIEAEVPAKISTNTGWFWANRYSKGGEKEFTKILKNPNIDKSMLLYATKLYYKQNNTARQAIGNYFERGTWETCYDEFVKNVKENKIEQHILSQISEGQSKYDTGI